MDVNETPAAPSRRTGREWKETLPQAVQDKMVDGWGEFLDKTFDSVLNFVGRGPWDHYDYWETVCAVLKGDQSHVLMALFDMGVIPALVADSKISVIQSNRPIKIVGVDDPGQIVAVDAADTSASQKSGDPVPPSLEPLKWKMCRDQLHATDPVSGNEFRIKQNDDQSFRWHEVGGPQSYGMPSAKACMDEVEAYRNDAKFQEGLASVRGGAQPGVSEADTLMGLFTDEERKVIDACVSVAAGAKLVDSGYVDSPASGAASRKFMATLAKMAKRVAPDFFGNI